MSTRRAEFERLQAQVVGEEQRAAAVLAEVDAIRRRLAGEDVGPFAAEQAAMRRLFVVAFVVALILGVFLGGGSAH
jgi:hypothetical protein